MKKFKQILNSLTLSTLIVPCVIGMEPGHFPFQSQKSISILHWGKKTIHDLPPKEESSHEDTEESALPAQEDLKVSLAQKTYGNQALGSLAAHKKKWDDTLEEARNEISHSQKKINQNALPQEATYSMACALTNYFANALAATTDTQEKAILAQYITTLESLIAIQKHLNDILRDAGKITKNKTAVSYLKSASKSFARRLKRAQNHDKKTILSDCIVEIRTAINKRQFPHQEPTLEPKKINPPATAPSIPTGSLHPFKQYVSKTLKVFREITQARVENALFEAEKTKTVAPLQQLVTSLATQMVDTDTNGDEQKVLNDFINQLQDETRNLQSRLKQQTETAPPPTCSNDTVHFYNHRNKNKNHKKTEPITNIPGEQSIASATPAPENNLSDQSSNAIMPKEQFQTILEAVKIEYQTSKSFNHLDEILDALIAKGASRSPEAATLIFLKNHPLYLLYDFTTPNQATKL